MALADLEKMLAELEGVRRTLGRDNLPEWRYHGRLVARQLDGDHLVVRADFNFRRSLLETHPTTFSVPARYEKHMMVVADFARGDAGAIEDSFDNAWQLQRSAD